MRVLIPILIYIAVPGQGLLLFLHLKEFIRRHQMPALPDIPLFLVFVSYGGWLMGLLTELFWHVSGMAALGAIYLIFIAPVVLGYFAWQLRNQRDRSQYHFRLFLACALYSILPVALMILVFIN